MLKIPIFSAFLFVSSAAGIFIENFLPKQKTPVTLDLMTANKNISKKVALENLPEEEGFHDFSKLFSKISLLSSYYSDLAEVILGVVDNSQELSDSEKKNMKTAVLSSIIERDLQYKELLFSVALDLNEELQISNDLKSSFKNYVHKFLKTWKLNFAEVVGKYKDFDTVKNLEQESILPYLK